MHASQSVVTLPTLQFQWSSGTVVNVGSGPFIQKTHPAGTRPSGPSGAGGAIGSSIAGTPSGVSSENVMAMGGVLQMERRLKVLRQRLPVR